MLSTANNFMFIHIPKTGGNAIQRALLPFSDDNMAPVTPFQDGIERFEIRSPELEIHKHSSLNDYRAQLDPETFARLTKITCIRNPWDRCVSYFFSPHRGNVTWSPEAFETFIESTIKPHRTYLELDEQSDDPFKNIDVVLRFERLDEDFADLCDLLGVGMHSLPRINSSKRGDYRSYYTTDHSIELVAKKFAAEIALFGYSF
ncbi:MAG: sulfotransferase family 2 domain-containing protein [Pararhodobacter sp.]|nr:sulfotransferase family 2 domain-containing protein [Pararhodobacter sp.]